MTDAEMRKLLEGIHTIAMAAYPFNVGPDNDTHLVAAFLEITRLIEVMLAFSPSRSDISDTASGGSAD